VAQPIKGGIIHSFASGVCNELEMDEFDMLIQLRRITLELEHSPTQLGLL
jgi:hypothetical protein